MIGEAMHTSQLLFLRSPWCKRRFAKAAHLSIKIEAYPESTGRFITGYLHVPGIWDRLRFAWQIIRNQHHSNSWDVRSLLPFVNSAIDTNSRGSVSSDSDLLATRIGEHQVMLVCECGEHMASIFYSEPDPAADPRNELDEWMRVEHFSIRNVITPPLSQRWSMAVDLLFGGKCNAFEIESNDRTIEAVAHWASDLIMKEGK